MAELCARQGRLGEAIRIYQRLLEQDPPAEKVERWTERMRALERAHTHAPEVEREPAPPGARAPDPFGGDEEITQVNATVPEPEPAPVPVPAPVAATPPPPPPPRSKPARTPVHQLPLVITQPVRSGQVFYARRNDLIVLGSVNSGGQVVADGNIHVYGALRGRAIAGAQGAAEARIFCQKLEAELLAISGIYLVYDDIPAAHVGKAAQISLRGDACVIGPL